MGDMVMTFERLACRVINQIDLDPVFRLIYGRAGIRVPRWMAVTAKERPVGTPCDLTSGFDGRLHRFPLLGVAPNSCSRKDLSLLPR